MLIRDSAGRVRGIHAITLGPAFSFGQYSFLVYWCIGSNYYSDVVEIVEVI